MILLIYLKCYGVLRDTIISQKSGNVMEMEVPENTSVAALLENFSVNKLPLRVFIDGISILDYETKLASQSEVVLLLPTTGG